MPHIKQPPYEKSSSATVPTTEALHRAIRSACKTGDHRWPAPGPGRRKNGAPASEKFLADRKSTRLNSSHMSISYAVFCLKKKKKKKRMKSDQKINNTKYATVTTHRSPPH